MDTKGVKKENVYLFQGQRKSVINSEPQVSPVVEQCVVIADNADKAVAKMKKSAPGLAILGYATLKQYEDTAAQIRATLKGASQEWKVFV